MKTALFVRLVALLALPATLHLQLLAAPLGTAFTYQGRLNDGGNPANGSYDLEFTLYDADIGPGAVAGPLTNAATAISNGLFTVTLDFGSGIFEGNARWLEIAVRTNGGGDFTGLSPRQELKPAPYALSAGTLTGIVPLAQLPGAVLTNNAAGVSLGGTFSGSAGGLTNLNSANLTGVLTVDPNTVKALGHTNNGGSASGVAVAGPFCYLANDTDGLRIYNIANPSYPWHVGWTNVTALDVAVAGNYCYLASIGLGLVIVNLSIPMVPSVVSTTPSGGFTFGVNLSGHYCYLANTLNAELVI